MAANCVKISRVRGDFVLVALELERVDRTKVFLAAAEEMTRRSVEEIGVGA